MIDGRPEEWREPEQQAAPRHYAQPPQYPQQYQQPAPFPQQVPAPNGGGGMIADRMPWLDLPKPWDNLEFQAWLDYPKEVADLWGPKQDGEETERATERNAQFLRTVFVAIRAKCACPGKDPQTCPNEHAPWQDRHGYLPPPTTEEFWERISTPLGNAMSKRFVEEMMNDPNAQSSKKKRRASWKRR